MYDYSESITIKKINPIILLLNIFIFLISIPIYLFALFIVVLITPILMLALLLVLTIDFILLAINKIILHIKLKPILLEAKSLYNINIIDIERIVYYKDNHFTSIKIPIRFKKLSNAIKEFKESTGSLDSDFLKKNLCKSTAINQLKNEKGNIFFSTIKNNKSIEENIHLYDLRKLDSNELKSLYTTNLSKEQKFILYKKYCLANSKERYDTFY